MDASLRVLVAAACVALMAGCSTGDGSGTADFDGSTDGTFGDTGTGDSGGFNFDASDADGGGCKKTTCAATGANCGKVADGCGGLLDCGTCTAPEICGAVKANVCGSTCKALTCADLKVNCGKQGDGCGGVIDCGSCTAPDTCGGGGPSLCGSLTGPCTAKTCTDLAANCGPISDGCGKLIDCGTCTGTETCGGGGTPNVCGGGSSCAKRTCADYPGTCGPQSDGCGGITASCGTCTPPEICGGGGTASVCGGGTGDGGATCVGLECKQVTCSGSATTSISGTVYDPAGIHGLPNVFVYVPNCTVTPFAPGASCDKCAAALSGCPLVQTTTDVNGKFSLTDMPVDTAVPVVIQIGRWRRQITVATAKCVDTPIAATLMHLPRTQAEGDIPKIALTTGAVDALECLLRKIGIADSEFTNPTGTGRVNLFSGLATVGKAKPTSSYSGGGAFPTADQLWDSTTASPASTPPVYGLQAYDVTVMACEGLETTANKPASALTAMQDYVNAGGRVFGSHYHYVWLKDGPTPWPGLISWNGTLEDFLNPTNETVLTTFPKATLENSWMKIWGGASAGTPSTFPVNEAKHSILKINDTTNVLDWINIPSGMACSTSPCFSPTTYTNVVEYVSFNTPVASTSPCGRFVFSDLHVASGDVPGKAFPNECTSTGMSAQETALEFMFFDLASRVCDETVPPPPPTCTPTTCGALGLSCGAAPDGCGGVLDCGPCTAPDTCGGGGTPGTCGHTSCVPQTCGTRCGLQGDGCGGTLTCPPCDSGTCIPLTCAGRCGPQGDGCGGTLSCPACDGGTCTPRTCAAAGAECGIIGDGCGGTIDCGSCTPPQTCGGGGTPYKCGGVK